MSLPTLGASPSQVEVGLLVLRDEEAQPYVPKYAGVENRPVESRGPSCHQATPATPAHEVG